MDKYNLDQLVKDVAAGDGSAYRRLLEVSAKLVRGYLLSKVNGPMRGDVEDIVQETLLAVHLKYNSYNAAMPYLPWLRTIAHHKLVDAFRRKKIGTTIALDDELNDTLPAADPSSDSTLDVERLMTQLNDKQQKVVRLARIDGKSMSEIASELSLSVADVKVTLHRAIRKLGDIAKGAQAHAHG